MPILSPNGDVTFKKCILLQKRARSSSRPLKNIDALKMLLVIPLNANLVNVVNSILIF